jgi:hypothetical protein
VMFEYPKRSPGQCMECADDLQAELTHLCGPCAEMLREEERWASIPIDAYDDDHDEEDKDDDQPLA